MLSTYKLSKQDQSEARIADFPSPLAWKIRLQFLKRKKKKKS